MRFLKHWIMKNGNITNNTEQHNPTYPNALINIFGEIHTINNGITKVKITATRFLRILDNLCSLNASIKK